MLRDRGGALDPVSLLHTIREAHSLLVTINAVRPVRGSVVRDTGPAPQRPDANAAELLDRPMTRYPGRYSRRQLRTLQLRVRQWRIKALPGWNSSRITECLFMPPRFGK